MKKIFGQIPAFALLLALLGCMSNPATVPAPVAEVPSLQIPESVAIDTTKAQSNATGSASLKASAWKAFVGAGGKFSEDIAFGPDINKKINDQIDQILAPLHQLVIPVTTAPNFHFVGAIFLNGSLQIIKIDFSKFNFDGTECSGNTAVLPICFRIWSNNVRLMAGIFTEFPTSGNRGAGRFKSGANDPGTGTSQFFNVHYDHHDLTNLHSESSFRIGFIGGKAEDDFVRTHNDLSQVGPEAAASFKTVKVSATVNAGFDLGSTVQGVGQYVGRWKEDQDFWSGTVHRQTASEGTFEDIKNQCAYIPTGEAAEPIECSSRSIDVGDTPFIPFATDADFIFPDDFPPTPTF